MIEQQAHIPYRYSKLTRYYNASIEWLDVTNRCIVYCIIDPTHTLITAWYGTIDRLLQGFMGNTYRTAFITHVAPKTDCGVESLNALRLIFDASQLQVHVPVAPYHPGTVRR